MKFRMHHLIVPLVLSLAGVAGAQDFTGSIGIQEDTSLTGSYTDSSLILDAANFTDPGSATGIFFDTVPAGTEVTAYSSDITGLSSTPENISIPDFVIIGTPGYFDSAGTTPNNRFDFDLQTLEEQQPGSFIATGTLIDTVGTYAPTPAELALNFSSASNYSFQIEAVPEPGTLTMALAALAMSPFFRRKN